jgi:phenylacetate-CoA ligase
MGRLDSIYEKLPVWAQHASVSLYGFYWKWLRFGPGYQRFLEGFIQRESFDASEWLAWQQHRLKEVLQLAAQFVPYYQSYWDRSERAAALAGRLEDLPLLDKEPLRADARAFTRQDIHPWRELVFHTSGSTGTPIATYWTAAEMRESIALREARSAGWAGVSYQEPRATFSARLVEPDPHSSGPYYRYNLAEKQVYFSAYHLRSDTALQYVQALQRHRITWLTGYTFSMYLLAKFILEQGLAIPPLKAVITTSEKLTPGMREIMEAAYCCRVFEEYSSIENVLFASECEHGQLHLSPDVAIVEILRPDGTACMPGEAGEVVATGLMRRYQPMIRYRLGDMAVWDPETCPCGRPMPVIREVLGRMEDVVVLPDGRQMVRFNSIFVDQPHVQEGQIIQESLTLIRVKVVAANGFDQNDVANISQRIQQRLGSQVQVEVEIVQSIPRSPAGKYKAVISRLHEAEPTEPVEQNAPIRSP